jgi:hypothetical protein
MNRSCYLRLTFAIVTLLLANSALTSPLLRFCAASLLAGLAVAPAQRQLDNKSRAATDLRLDVHGTVVTGDNFAYDGQSKTGTAFFASARLIGAVEAIVDVRQVGWVDTNPGVLKFELDFFAAQRSGRNAFCKMLITARCN